MPSNEFVKLREKVAEIFVVRASGYLLDSQRQYPAWELSNSKLKTLLENGLGGVILYGGTVNEIKERSRNIQNWSKHPILISADVEEGVGQRFEGGSFLPPPMTLGLNYLEDSEESLLLAEEYGKCIGTQARRCGLNWVLAPVCDVNSNPLNPVINMRAWGTDPLTVAALVCAFNKGLSSQGVMGCAKHFPGHGDTKVDSHLELPLLDHDFSRLEEIELVPFKALIDQGINSVMTAHVLFRNIDPTNLATFSKMIVTNLLRQKLGFNGLIVTDALIMRAISESVSCAESAVMAFEAGADLILMPEDPFQAIDSIVESIMDGKVPISRLEESLQRRRRAMSNLTTNFASSEKEAECNDVLIFEQPEDHSLVKRLIDISVQINKPSHMQISGDLINLITVDTVLPCPYFNNSSPALLIPQEYGCKTILCHPFGVSPWQDNDLEPLALERLGQGPFLLQLFVRGNPFRGNQDINERWIAAVEQLQRNELLSAVVVYGSFYFWKELHQVLTPSIPLAYSPGQMRQAQLKILQSLFKTSGHDLIDKNVEFTN
ncbi:MULTISPECIES: glycoside hydrolase family 3 N-terminal domain-containing protein [unclassified Prochlorococcus]|uniref:glycoside hydrolase family 3 N-terminal domain-containing protein n=1 Tax=unclassified Prochlorococcus TaxID=2627481 RepID=UPI000533886E|nr:MULTISPECIES: glycoside hydrolase family 3 N-terminal domain-containing protein [unclassified Prochlorococcus]KGG16824.1 Beta-glucosidase-related glycosidase [Prochlorococcus sp. MIT 0602]KGG18202.1 Beta-glucosidase-related glycosidase [Prochlorococcus sp. MIT 0603]